MTEQENGTGQTEFPVHASIETIASKAGERGKLRVKFVLNFPAGNEDMAEQVGAKWAKCMTDLGRYASAMGYVIEGQETLSHE